MLPGCSLINSLPRTHQYTARVNTPRALSRTRRVANCDSIAGYSSRHDSARSNRGPSSYVCHNHRGGSNPAVLPNDDFTKCFLLCSEYAAIYLTLMLTPSAQYLDVIGDLCSFSYVTIAQYTIGANVNTAANHCRTTSKESPK